MKDLGLDTGDTFQVSTQEINVGGTSISYMIPAVGFDSKELTRQSGLEDQGFFSSLGASVEVFDEKKFKNEYVNALHEVMEDYGLSGRRDVAKFYYFCRKLGSIEEASDLCEDFIDRIKGNIFKVNIYFTIIPPSKVPEIYMYNIDNQPASKPTKEFLRSLTPSYTHLCAWKYCDKKEEVDEKILMDHFQGKMTVAWQTLWHESPEIYFRGDSCNPLISTADIIGALIDQKISDGGISDNRISDAIDELGLNGEEVFIGQPDFDFIVPVQRKQIQFRRHIKHPIFFIVGESSPSGMDRDKYRRQLEFSKIYDEIVNAAWRENGAIKMYDETQDFTMLEPGEDRIIHFGERGEEIAEQLSAQYDVKSIHAKHDEIK